MPEAPKHGLSENRLLHRRGKAIYQLYQQKHFAEAIPQYLDIAQQADQLADYASSAKYLINAGGVQLMIFRYQDALSTMERARKAAEKTGDRDVIAVANSNIASLYLQMGNPSSAAVAGGRALAVLRETHPQYARLLIPVAQISAEQHDLPQAENLIRRAIDGAYREGDVDTAAWALDYLGYRYTLEHRLEEADRFLTESLRIRKMFGLTDLSSPYFHLARLRSEQGDLRSAAALLNSAVEELSAPGTVTPAWIVYFEQGRLLALSGNRAAAWSDLGTAVRLSRDWRAEIVANDANRTSAEETLSELYALYIDVGNTYAAERGLNLARETFQAVEENRAASLRALAERETGWHTKLPADYWEYLAQLQTAERAELIEDSLEHREQVSHLRSVLDEMEAASGAPLTFVTEPAALATQKKLDENTVFLSFQLGQVHSWVWAVTRDDVAVFPLPARSQLTRQIREFQEGVRRGAPTADQKGAELYRVLFGALPVRFSRRDRWLFSLDQELFSLPMPGLVVRFENSQPVYLGTEHALEATPGALIYAASHARNSFAGPMLAVGDGIYNRADPRLAEATIFAGVPSPGRTEAESESTLQFARLWGAAREIQSVENTWNTPGSVLISGPALSRSRIWQELDRKPAVIHFATHILEANDQLHTGWIALSIDPGGTSEFLSPADISAHKLSTGLVVLNGCSSGNGEIRAASGLMGLTRAWIAAGASGVLATRWPGPDDTGTFFNDFYRNLKSAPEKGPAYALREARRSALRSGGWRAKPQFWASYFLTGIN